MAMNELDVKQRAWPWIEGFILATLVLVVVTLGGESLRVSYHGLLHTTIGEAVLRDGLLPENPYHAGQQLNYYTLYPALGVLLGRLGGGPLWGFALLNIFAALLIGPALDSVGRRLKLDFAARRSAFWCMVLGFNFFGYWLARDVAVPPLGALPMLILEPTTNFFDLFSWDARLQSFVAKFLNVSSFACSLPLMLFALSNALADTRRSRYMTAVLLGFCVAINPLVGAFSALLVVFQAMATTGLVLQQLKTWAGLSVISLAIAVPFILPLLLNNSSELASAAALPFVGDGALFNLLGPCLLLIVMAAFSIMRTAATARRVLVIAMGLAVLFSFSHLPFNNEYKFPRLLAIFLAIPAGNFVASFSTNIFKKALVLLVVALSVPTAFNTVKAYSSWNIKSALSLEESSGGKLVPRADGQGASALPQHILDALADTSKSTVVMMHPRHPGAGSMGLGSQGNQWAPVLNRVLFVDRLQIHNQSHLSEVRQRLDMSVAVWEGKRWPAKENSLAYPAHQALADARQEVAGRQLAVIGLSSHSASYDLLQQSAAATLVARQDDVCLWLLSAVPRVDEN